MLTLLLTACLLVSALSENADVSSNVCGSCINNICYTDSINVENSLDYMYFSGIPAFDVTENILYYSTHISSKYIKLDKDMRISFTKDVPGMPYGLKGYTVDQKTRQVYIWTKHNKDSVPSNRHIHSNPKSYNPTLSNKVYRYDPVTSTNDELSVTREAIKEMHFKEKLYYTLKFRNGIFVYHNGTSNSILAFEGYNVTQFIVDKLEDVYATTENGVYRLRKDAGQVTLFTDKKYSVSVDKDEEIYFLELVLNKVLKLDYSSDKIVDAGVIESEVGDRFIFDKHNNVLFKCRAIGEGGIWALILPRGQCRKNGTSFYIVPNSSGSLHSLQSRGPPPSQGVIVKF